MQFQKKTYTSGLPQKRRGGVGAIVFILLAGAALICACYYASGLKGSSERQNDEYAEVVDGEKALQYRRESESLESAFNAQHEFKKGNITEEDINNYEKAIIAYEKYLSFSGVDKRANPRTDKMRRRLHNLRADNIRAKTIELEEEAEKLAAAKKYEEAKKVFEIAAAQEERINKQFALADKKNYSRTVHLKNRVLLMQAIPMKAKADELERDGNAALEVRNWARANKCFREALKILQELWADYRDVITVGPNSISNLNIGIETAESAADYEESLSFCERAKAAEEKGEYENAKLEWEKALEKQKILSKNFPRSKFAAEERLNELNLALANSGARKSFVELQGVIENIQKGIRERKFGDLALQARRSVVIAEKINEEFPSNSLVSKELLSNLRYIDVKSRDLEQIFSIFFEQMIEIPNCGKDRLMMKKEVSQAFYTFVIGINPSADKSKALAPVESIDYAEAEIFCQRMGVLTGYEVRLPTIEEFTLALGKVNAEDVPEIAWTLENSGGKIKIGGTRKPNANGFYDLLGNVSEWVLSPDGTRGSEGYVVGGDCQFPVEMILHENQQKTFKTERNRLRGFRVVIDFSKPVDLLKK